MIASWNFASDVNDHRLAFPVLHQLLLANMSIQKLLCKIDAGIFHELSIGLQAAVERHRNPPRPRESIGVLDRDFVMNGIGRHRREALSKVEISAMEVASPVEPVLSVKAGHINNKGIAFPSPDRMTHE